MTDAFGRSLLAAARLCIRLAPAKTERTGPPGQSTISVTSTLIEHVRIETATPYPTVKSRLTEQVKRFHERYRELLKAGKIEELRAEVVEGLEPHGFMIHFVAEHGDLMALEGGCRPGSVFFVGNVLAAAQMTKLDFSAALYAPLRLNIYENDRGGTAFEFDKPSTQFGQFHNIGIDKVARTLDERMMRLIETLGQ